MCELLYYIFCCGCCRGGDRQKKRKKRRKKITKNRTTLYGTDWESKVNVVDMTPSQIEDSMVTKEIKTKKMYLSKKDMYVDLLNSHGYELNELLGEGTFGWVYKIQHKETQEIRAVKIMEVKNAYKRQNRFNSFKNEIFTLRKTSHKNIIQLFDHFMVDLDNRYFSFMTIEYATEGDLKKRLDYKHAMDGKGFDEYQSKLYFTQIANAMYFVHSKGLIHGDLKLDNILITRIDGKEVIKVTDFGCALVSYKPDEGLLMKEQAGGTVMYMAPEQIRVFLTVNKNRPDLLKHSTKRYNPFRADVFSLGVCLYRLLFYDYPYTQVDKGHIEILVDVLKEMKRGFNWPKNMPNDLSNSCKDLLRGLLEYKKIARLDMRTVMTHKWISDCPELDIIALDPI